MLNQLGDNFFKKTFVESLLYTGTGKAKLGKTHLALRELDDINTEVVIISYSMVRGINTDRNSHFTVWHVGKEN